MDLIYGELVPDELRQAIESLQGIIASIPLPMVALDEGRRVVLWNRAAERAAWWSESVVAGQPLFLSGEAERDFEVMCDEVLGGREVRDVSLRLARKRGARVDLLVSGGPIREASGRVRGVVALMVDMTEQNVTERTRQELLVREQIARAEVEATEFRSSLLARLSKHLDDTFDLLAHEPEAALAGVAELLSSKAFDCCRIDLLRPDGSVVGAAEAKQGKTCGESREYPPQAAAERHPGIRVLRADGPIMIETLRKADLNELYQDDRERERLPAGLASLIAVRLVARRRAYGSITLGSFISGRLGPAELQLAEELGHRIAISLDNARLYQEAERAVKVREDVLAMVAHDLRNPLNVISLGSQVLLRALPAGPEQEQAGVIVRAGENMRKLISGLLEIAASENDSLGIDRRPTDLRHAIRTVIELNTPTIEAKHLSVRVRMHPDLQMVVADPDRLVQAISNLLSNAVRFSPEGGSVTILTEERDPEMVLAISDEGPGIPPAEQATIFNRFSRRKQTRKGSFGLGLAITKGIIEAHGGRVWVESALGEGSTFFFSIPTDSKVDSD